MPIERVDERVAPAFTESGNTFGEGMDRAAIELRRTDGKTEVAKEELHDTGLFLREKSREVRDDLADYSHQAEATSKGVFGRIGDWFSQKGDEIKDSSVGTTVSHVGSGLEAKTKEQQAKLQRKAEEASERHDDSFLTTIGHKIEEAKLLGEEKVQGWKADLHKEQVKNDFGIKTTDDTPKSSSLFGIRKSNEEKDLDAEVRRLQDAQRIVEKPDPHMTERLGHRVIDGKQMPAEHIETKLGSGISQPAFTDASVTDTTDMVSGIDLNGIHSATRDSIRAQNQAERDMFHGRGNLMNSGSETGVRFDAADRTKIGQQQHSSLTEKISDFIHHETSAPPAVLETNPEFSKYRVDPRFETLPSDINANAFNAFRTEDF